MISLDDRVGSGELEKYFKPYGIQVVKRRLSAGDMAFDGQGPHGLAAIGVERKKILDLIDSMKSKRFAGSQLPGMANLYDYGYLIVEGCWRRGAEGNVEVQQFSRWVGYGMHFRAVTNFLFGLQLRAGVLVWKTYDERETVDFTVDQYRMWQKPWSEHKAQEATYAPVGNGNTGAGWRMSLRPRVVGLAEKWACQLPGIESRARVIAGQFGSAGEMAGAGVEKWEGLKWRDKNGKQRRLGRVTAEKIVREIQGVEGEGG